MFLYLCHVIYIYAMFYIFMPCFYMSMPCFICLCHVLYISAMFYIFMLISIHAAAADEHGFLWFTVQNKCTKETMKLFYHC